MRVSRVQGSCLDSKVENKKVPPTNLPHHVVYLKLQRYYKSLEDLSLIIPRRHQIFSKQKKNGEVKWQRLN